MANKKMVDESATVEWKQSVAEINEIIETAVAFANTQGGRIFIGISPKGKVLGVQSGKGTIEKYGSGIYLENELCIKNGNEKPLYEITSNQTKVIFKSQIKENTIAKSGDKNVDGLNERQNRLIASGIKDVSRKEYAEILECSLRTASNDLKGLLIKNIVKQAGAGKYIRYLVK